jgi:hypothetical protein
MAAPARNVLDTPSQRITLSKQISEKQFVTTQPHRHGGVFSQYPEDTTIRPSIKTDKFYVLLYRLRS